MAQKFDEVENPVVGETYSIYSKYGGQFKAGGWVDAKLISARDTGSVWSNGRTFSRHKGWMTETTFEFQIRAGEGKFERRVKPQETK